MSRLPVELTDIIIAFVSSDRAALRTCSLVRKDWLPASRRYLIPTIILKEPEHTSALVELLTAPSSTIAKYVHTVDIHAYMYVTPQPFSTIAQPLEILVGIKTLTVIGHSSCVQPIQEQELERLSIWFANITTLDLFVDAFRHPEAFFTFLYLFRALRILRLQQHGHLGTKALPSSMRVINMHFRRTPDFTLPKPGEFRFEVGLRQLLHSCGPSIQLLDISFSFDLDVFRILCDHLVSFFDLRVLRIVVIGNSSYPDGPERFTELVSQITSEHMTKITLQFQCPSRAVEEGTTSVDWTKLAHTLNHPRFFSAPTCGDCRRDMRLVLAGALSDR